MDSEIEDIKRRAGLSEATDMTAYQKMGEFLSAENVFLGNLGRVLSQAMAPDRARKTLAIIIDRRNKIDKLGQEIEAIARQEQNQTQQQKYQRAEQAKAGGPRRPSGSA